MTTPQLLRRRLAAARVAKHMGPGAHPNGTDQAVHGVQSYGTTRESAEVAHRAAVSVQDFLAMEDESEEARVAADTWFGGEITMEDGSVYRSQVVSTWDGEINGRIVDADGKPAGQFKRVIDNPTTIYNSEFTIPPEHQGKGLGTALLAHWEGQLAEAGFTEMRVSAQNRGVYAWAVAGYSFENDAVAYEGIMSELEYDAQRKQDEGEGFYTDAETGAMRFLAEKYERDGYLDPIDIAMIGAGTDDHIGKRLITAILPMGWEGFKQL